MNPYLLFLSVYAVLITPIRAHWSLRLGRRSGYWLRLQAAGLPFVSRKITDDAARERPIHERDVAKSLGSLDWALLRAALRKQVLGRLARRIRLEEVAVYARFSFADAKTTALCYQAARTVLQMLSLCGFMPSALSGRVEANFKAQGSEVRIRGILGARLGSIALAAILLGAALVRERGRDARAKEERYAASH